MPPVMQARVSLSPPRDTALRRASSKGDNGLRHGLLTGLHMAIVRTNFIAGAAQIVAESLLHIVSPLHGFLHPITSGKVVQGLRLFCCPHSSGREQAVKDRSAASDFLQFSPFPLLHDFQTIPPYMAEQKQHPHTCGLCFGQCRTKLRLCADIWPHLGDAFHLNHESHCAPIPCPLRLR